MRIVYYVVGWPPERFPNGVVSAVSRLAPEIRRMGHDAKILASIGDAADDDAGVSVIKDSEAVPSKASLLMRSFRKYATPDREIFDIPPRKVAARLNSDPQLVNADIVEIEDSFGWSRIVARMTDASVVTRLHGPFFLTGAPEGVGTRFAAKRIRREGAAIRCADYVTAPSHFVLGAVREHYECKLEGAAVIPNPARLIDPASGWRVDRADSNEILFVGRFDRIKGADILLDAFALLAKDRPQLKLTFAGPNDGKLLYDGRERTLDQYVSETMNPEIAGRIKILGVVRPGDLAELRNRARVTVIASRIEVFPNILLEALAHGSPTAAANVGGIPEIARDGVEALLAPSENPGALAERIIALLDDTDLAARLGEQGRRRVAAEFAPARVAQMTIAHYENIIAGRRAGDADNRIGAI